MKEVTNTRRQDAVRVVEELVYAFLHEYEPMLKKLPIITATSLPLNTK